MTAEAGASAPSALAPASAALLQRLADSGAPPASTLSVEAIRGRLVAMRKMAGKAPMLDAVEDLAGPYGTAAMRSYTPIDVRADATLVFLHGGGWIAGELDDFDVVCAHLAGSTGRRVVSVGYALAPESPWPAQLNDAARAVRWLRETLDGKLVLVGESAGAGLVLGCAIRGIAADLHVLLYPVTDAAAETPIARQPGGPPLPVDAPELAHFLSLALPDGFDRTDPELSPLRADDLGAMPPTQLWLAGHDPLLGQGLAYGRRLADAGVAVDQQLWGDQFHGFLTMGSLIPAAADAWNAIAARISRALDPDPSASADHPIGPS